MAPNNPPLTVGQDQTFSPTSQNIGAGLGSVAAPNTGPQLDNSSISMSSNLSSWESVNHEEASQGHSTLEVVQEAYFDNFFSPEHKAAPAPQPIPDTQSQFQSTVSSTGWATASAPPDQNHVPAPPNYPPTQEPSQGWSVPQQFQPQQYQTNAPSPAGTTTSPGSVPNYQPNPHYPTTQDNGNPPPQQFQSNAANTGAARNSIGTVPQYQRELHYPAAEDLSPLSMPAAVPQPLFSRPASTVSAMMATPTSTVSTMASTPSPSLASKVPTRMPSNAAPPVLRMTQPRQVEAVSFASCCCQCNNAISYNMYYYNCTYCKLDICGTCFQAGKHPWVHLPSMVRLNAQGTRAGDRRQDKQCQSCKAMKHRRMDCDECPYTICVSCYSSDAVPPHQHKSFQLKATPGLTLNVRRGDGSPCCTKPSFGHCGRCYATWKPEEWMVQCKTCLFEFEEVVALCLQCDSEILSACRQSNHQLVSMKCRQKLRSEEVPGQQSYAAVECTECAIQFQSMTDISFLRHPHPNYDYLFFTEDREHLFAAVYRSCKKKSIRVDTPLAPQATTTKCTYCHHNVPLNVAQSCLPCPNTKYCPHCYPIASPTHHHGPSHFISLRDTIQTQLGGGWTQRKNSSGRIWYHHTAPNSRSFEFPRSAIGQAAPPSAPTPAHVAAPTPMQAAGPVPVPMKPANQRRATTGGIPNKPTGPLPPGWEARKTPDGRRYYANHSTKQTSWVRPASMPRPGRQQRPGSVPLNQAASAGAPVGGVQWEQDANANTASAVPLTAEQKAAQREEAKKAAQRKKLYTKIGTSVLKGVVSGVISS
ncbi:uncharacterized protein PAC_18506 [Phialocephala subalpina]|uniref:WW domain-containing protein n=1 Tax=Phialocephala subalpina TaxID=576137 RepID=A0A1L7XUF1_9HELO|nr:uncharacterized protein PAC_18506 [Phialocephala subalpina]